MSEDGKRADVTAEPPPVPVFFLSDSTGITAETMGNALLIQFPHLRFERRLIPFISSVDEARRVVAILDAAATGPVMPLAFSTAAVEEVRQELLRTTCPLIDFFDLHMARVESILGAKGVRIAARLHGMGDVQRYNARMAAVEYAIEHDDGQSMRALHKADVILVAPIALRQDTNNDVPRPAAWHFRRQLSAGRGGLRDCGAATPGAAAARAMLRHDHYAGPP